MSGGSMLAVIYDAFDLMRNSQTTVLLVFGLLLFIFGTVLRHRLNVAANSSSQQYPANVEPITRNAYVATVDTVRAPRQTASAVRSA